MKVLIAYNGSEHSRVAINDLHCAGFPADVDAAVVTVADVLPHLLEATAETGLSSQAVVLETMIAGARARAHKAVAEAKKLAHHGAQFVQEQFPTWKVHDEVIAGGPAWKLIQCAQSLHADLVVLGWDGQSVLGRLMLGSVPQQVLHHAACSVRIARKHASGSDQSRPVKVLVGVDGSPNAFRAIKVVGDRKWPEGSEIRIVTVADERVLQFLIDGCSNVAEFTPRGPAHLGQEAAYQAKLMLASAADHLKGQSLRVDSCVLQGRGDAKHALVSEALEWGADCIFLGAHGMSRLERLLIGSVSLSVAACAPCTVEVVR